ncbi:hypothetical protein ACJMK2_040066, partial [Sinanodonta woodiana]
RVSAKYFRRGRETATSSRNSNGSPNIGRAYGRYQKTTKCRKRKLHAVSGGERGQAFKFARFDVLGINALVKEAPPITRQIGPKTTHIHITGLLLDVDEDELCNKILERFNVGARPCQEAKVWGWTYIASGVRIITVSENEAHKFPIFFYCMGFCVR